MVAYDNRQHGVYLNGSDAAALSGVLSFGNDLHGIYLFDALTATVSHVTCHDNVLNGLTLVDSPSADVRDSILWAGPASTGYSIYVDANSQASFASDYNNLLASTGVTVGRWGSIDCPDLVEWRKRSAQDSNSISQGPLFADGTNSTLAQRDYHLKSLAGRWTEGGWVTDLATSPSVDAGNPGSSFALEPTPNGSRANQGAYGNTAQASKTPFTLALAKTGSGDGQAEVNGVLHALPYSEPFAEGAVVTLSASPAAGSRFDAWSGDVVTSTASVTLTMDGDKAVTLTFVRQHTLTMAVNDPSGGSTSPTVGPWVYDIGSVVAVSASANAWWRFDYWDGDVAATLSADTTVTMDADKTVTAYFLQQMALTLTTSPPAEATLNPAAGVHLYDPGTVVTISATLQGNTDRFVRWEDGLAATVSLDPVITVTMNAHTTRVAVYMDVTTLYVNDGVLAKDVYTSAVGNDANSGTLPSRPKATVQSVIASFALAAGDRVLVDTGAYSLTSALTLTAADQGASGSGNDLAFIGSTDDEGTLFDAAGQAYGFHADTTQYVTLQDLRFTGATSSGVLFTDPTGCVADGVVVYLNGADGIRMDGATDCRVVNSTAYNNGESGVAVGGASQRAVVTATVAYGNNDDGVLFAGAVTATAANLLCYANGQSGIAFTGTAGGAVSCSTFHDNDDDGVRFESGSTQGRVWNCIAAADGDASRAAVRVDAASTAGFTSNYNDLFASGGANVGHWSGAAQATLGNWTAASSQDGDSISRDPLFADGTNDTLSARDYHPQSTAGRWTSSGWVVDTQSSRAIDAADPTSDFAAEPAPNGSRRNLGFYGNSAQASQTPYPVSLTVVGDGAGSGQVTISTTVHALPAAATFTVGSVVTLSAQPDAGSTFDHWSGDASGMLSPATITLTANKSVTVTFALAPSPLDGAIVYDRAGSIYSGYLDGSAEARLTDGTGGDSRPAMSRDGASITFERGNSLWKMNYDGSGQAKIVDKAQVGNNNVASSDWAPGDSWIYFDAVSGASAGGIWRVKPDGTNLALVRSGYVTGLRVRPSAGDRFAFSQRRTTDPNSANVRITDLLGGSEETVTTGTVSPSVVTHGTCWSPDGGAFAYNQGLEHVFVGSYPSPYGLAEVKTFAPGTTSGRQLVWLDGETLIYVHEPSSNRLRTLDVNTQADADLGLNGEHPYVRQQPHFDLLVAKDGTGDGQANVAGTVRALPYSDNLLSHTVVTLTALPAAGSRFEEWSGDVAATTTAITVTMDGDRAVTATFVREYTLTMAVNDPAGGSVTPTPGPHVYDVATVVAVTATPSAGWRFDYWAGDVSDPNAAATTVTVDADKTATAHFVETVELTLAVAAGGGAITPTAGVHTYDLGSVVSLSAGPDVGWQFVGWTGSLTSPASPVTLTMDSDKAVTATFAMTQYVLDLNVVPPAGGAITATPPGPTYTYGTVVTLAAAANVGWSFGSWSGDATGTATPVTLTMDGDKAVTATFGQIQYTLTTDVAPPGSGAADPVTATATYGMVITATATPAAGWALDQWIGDVTTTANPVGVTMDGNKAITATFSLVPYTLTTIVDPNGSGTITVDPLAATYTYGAVVTLSATPVIGWQFDDWSGAVTGAASPVTLTMDGDKAVTATFSQIVYELILSVAPPGSGTITANPAGPTYTYGTVVTLTPVANPFWRFNDWSGDVTGTATPVTITMDFHKAVTASFTAQHSLTILVNDPAGGATTPTPGVHMYDVGTNVVVTATPSASWRFDGWTGDVPVTLTGSPVATITMNANKTVTANFAQTADLTLAVVNAAGGAVTPTAGVHTYDLGTVVTLAASPNVGWGFGGWSGDAAGAGSPITVTMDGDKAVTATFTQIQYILDLNADPPEGGTILVSPPGPTYTYGAIVQLSAVTNDGWVFDEWEGDASGAASPVTLTINGNKAVTATFSLIPYTLTTAVVPPQGGTITVDPEAVTYTYGTVVTLTATPTIGWELSGWSGDVTGTASPVTVTIDGNKAVTATFGQIPYVLTLTANPSGGGTISRNPVAVTYTYGTVVTLTPQANAGWGFGHWSGDVTGSGAPATLTIDGNKAVTATFGHTAYTLTTTVVPPGSGTITVQPAAATYTWGTVLTLTATPVIGWTFDGWSGDVIGAASPVTLTIDGSKAVTATFSQIPYTLTVIVDPAGAGTYTADPQAATYTYGSAVTLVASADPGWGFVWWWGDAVGYAPTLTVVIDGDKVVTTTFGALLAVTTTVDPVASGTVTTSPVAGPFPQGGTVTLSATPAWGYAFSHWLYGPPVRGWGRSMGSSGQDDVQAAATDASGNVFLTGAFAGSVDFDPTGGGDVHTATGERDVFVTKLNSDGSYGWTRSVGGSGLDQGLAIATDSAGNVLVAGLFNGSVDFDPSGAVTETHTSAGFSDIFAMKFDNNGAYAWARTMGGSSLDAALGVAADSGGNVILAGYFRGTNVDLDPTGGASNHSSNGFEDVFVTKLQSDGSFSWSRTMGDVWSDQAADVAVDGAGNVYVAGTFLGTVDFDPTGGADNHTSQGQSDVFLTMLTSAGSYTRTQTLGGSSWDEVGGVALDSAGNVYLAGHFRATADLDPTGGTDNHTALGDRDVFAVRINSDTTFGWARAFGGAAADQAFGLAVDSGTGLYVTGAFRGTADFDPTPKGDFHTAAGTSSIFLTKLDTSGAYQWAHSMGGTGADEGRGVATYGTARVVVAGLFFTTADLDPTPASDVHTSAGNSDLCAVQFNRDGSNGCASSSAHPLPLLVEYNTVATATFSPVDFVLTATVSPADSGAVTVSPARWVHPYLTTVSLTAEPNIGWDFDRWTGSVSSTANPVTLTILANEAVTATFEAIQYNLATSVAPSGSGGITVTPPGPTYTYGTVVTLTANPNAGWRFDFWSDDLSGTGPTATLTMDSDKTVTAHFMRQWVLTMQVDDLGHGTTEPAIGKHVYDTGAVVAITATANAGWRFDNWTGGAAAPGSATSAVSMNADKTLTAIFQQTAVLTITASPGAGGTTTPAPASYVHDVGTVVTLTAIPNAGWRFDGWTGDVAQPASATTTVTVDDDKEVVANFVELHTLTMCVDDPARGVTTPTVGPHIYDAGTVVSVAAGAIKGWQFDSWIGNVADTTTAATTITMNADQVVTATFRPATTLIVLVNPLEGGVTTPTTGVHIYDVGLVVTLSAAPNDGYRFDSWQGGVAQPTAATTTVTMSVDRTVTAMFVRQYPLTLAVDDPAHGTTTPTPGPHIYDEGTVVTVSASAYTGWRFDYWVGDVAVTTSAVTTVTVDSAKTVTAIYQQTAAITIAVAPSGGGVTTPTAGAHIYDMGSVVTLSAAANAGHRFDHWAGDVATPASAVTTLTVDGDKAVTATFVPQFILTLGVDDPAHGTTTPSPGQYVHDVGTVVAISATANAGWRFDYWLGDVAHTLSAATTVTMDVAQTVTAVFQQTAELTLALTPSGGGVTTPTAGSHTYDVGAVVTVSAAANAGLRFGYWLGDVANTLSAATTVTIDASKTVTAHFIRRFVLTVAVDDPAHGATTPTSGAYVYDEGSVVAVSATANAGWRFDHWLGDVAQTMSAGTTVTVDVAKTVTAVFQQTAVVNISVLPEGGGVTTPTAGAHVYDIGTVVTVSAAPNAGYRFHAWVGPVTSATAQSTTLTVDRDKAVTAVFVRQYVLSMSVDDPAHGTTVPVPGDHVYDAATQVPIQAFANSGWRFDHWTGNVASTTSASTTIIMGQDESVQAVYAPNAVLTLAAIPVDGGATAPTVGVHVYDLGTVVTVTASPAFAHRFLRWAGDVANTLSAVTTVTLDHDKDIAAVFEEVYVTLTSAVDPAPAGVVSAVPTGPVYRFGTTVTLTATSSLGYRFSHWRTKSAADGWTWTFGGAGSDECGAVATDGSGNVLVSGRFSGTVDFDPTGADDQHTAAGSWDAFVTKFGPDGSYVWTRTWGGTGFDHALALATDASGSVFVCGYFNESVDFDPGAGAEFRKSAGSSDSYLLKLAGDGSYQWVHIVGGLGSDSGTGVCTDSAGNILMTGLFSGTVDLNPTASVDNRKSAGSTDVFVTKINTDATYGWSGTLGSSGQDYAWGIAADAAGNAFVVGDFLGKGDLDPTSGNDVRLSNGDYDVFLVKVLSGGSYGWGRTLGGQWQDHGAGVAVDSSGHVLIAGYFSGTVDFNPNTGSDPRTSQGSFDAFVTKLDNAGAYGWTASFGGLNWDGAADVAVDAADNVLLIGRFWGTVDFDPSVGSDPHTSLGDFDSFVTEFTAAGGYRWTRTVGGADDQDGCGVAADPSGNVCAVGHFVGSVDFDPTLATDVRASVGERDVFVQKLTGAGEYQDTINGANPLPVYMDGNKAITATFAAAISQLTLNGSGAGKGWVEVNGVGRRLPYTEVFPSGAAARLNAQAADGCYFAGWSGGLTGETNPVTVTMDGDKVITASYGSTVKVVFGTNPKGLPLYVDGSAHKTPYAAAWAPDSSHPIGADSPITSDRTRYVYLNWQHGGDQWQSLIAPRQPATYLASFKRQVLVTTSVDPVGAGTVSLTPTSADGWYDDTVKVRFTANAAPGFAFGYWEFIKLGTSTSNPTDVSLSKGSIAVIAHMSAISAMERPELIAPVGEVADRVVTFRWAGPAGAASYELWVSRDRSRIKPVIVVKGLTQTETTPVKGLEDERYVWWIKAVDAEGSGVWSLPAEFGKLPQPITAGLAPDPVSPRGEAKVGRLTFTWTAVAGASTYDLWLAKAGDKCPLYRGSGIKGTSETLAQALPEGRYVWTVRACSAGRLGPWSAAMEITVK